MRVRSTGNINDKKSYSHLNIDIDIMPTHLLPYVSIQLFTILLMLTNFKMPCQHF